VSTSRSVRARLIIDRDHYVTLIKAIEDAKVSVWISTANVKSMMIEAPIGTVARARGKYVSILDTFDGLAQRGVDLRLLHAGLPSGPFRTELRKHPGLVKGAADVKPSRGLAIRQCPRVHLKVIAIDGRLLYLGSANFTGAGLGAKGDGRRNFEMGVLTDDDVMLDTVQERFDAIWSGKECKGCKLRRVCPAPLDQKKPRAASRATPQGNAKAARPRIG
jgi:phosphatidylserine/phosphatidylglycerophosphate/cardiolipin synthase-like enzyme